MNLVLAGSGSPMSCETLARLVSAETVSLVMLPRQAGRSNPLRQLAARVHVPSIRTSEPHLNRLLEDLRPDLLVCASFPERISAEALRSCRRGGLNIHPSLLPRHRGPDPIFWTYVGNDRETGVTIHEMTSGIDEGPVVWQDSISLARGRDCIDLYHELSNLGVQGLMEVIAQMNNGGMTRREQEPGGRPEPRPERPGWQIPLQEWDVERTWHVLSGLGGRYHFLLRDLNGAPCLHGRGTSTEVGESRPGEVFDGGDEWVVHAVGGTVRAVKWRDRTRLPDRLRSALARILGYEKP